jgi:hypothetical protein
VEWPDDIFDILDDNNDECEHTTEELNCYFESGHLNSIMEEEVVVEDDTLSDHDDVQVKIFTRSMHNITMFFFI